MRNLVFFMHSSLDGFAAGPNGEMDWIKIDESLFEFVATLTSKADTALYGRVTYQMMEAYWPQADKKPNATKHDIEHAAWYRNVPKVVLSRTLKESGLTNTTVIRDQLAEKINAIKRLPGKDILIFGSPSASHALLDQGLIDEFWLFVNPVLLGQGKPLFKNIHERMKLRLVETKTFDFGVIALHYARV
ncbi:MAG: dihydrofolate reductase family protein [Cyclobacteriaceae bacterium]|nr:dihydrofolate reductase family protein [Cyclobacteriaceae bacterium]